MPDVPAGRTLTAETVLRMAREQVGIAVSDSELEQFLPVLNGLLADIEPIEPLLRDAEEPAVTFAAEGWPA
jgi:hypothetical protein